VAGSSSKGTIDQGVKPAENVTQTNENKAKVTPNGNSDSQAPNR
jgi:hypothetical protein